MTISKYAVTSCAHIIQYINGRFIGIRAGIRYY